MTKTKTAHCHNCKTAQAIARGKYRRTPWQKTPCAVCWLPPAQQQHAGRTHRQFNPELDTTPAPETVPPDHTAGPDINPADLVPALSYLVKSLLSLSPRAREIVMDRIAYPTRPIRVVAERLGIRTQSAHGLLKHARKQWPALAATIPMRGWTWSRPGGKGKA